MKKNETNTLLIALFLLLFGCAAAGAESFRFVHYSVSNGLASNTVRAIAGDSKGFVWIGTDNGLHRFDGSSFKSFQYLPGDSTGLGSDYIYSLYEDRLQRLWVGTSNGVYYYLPESEQFRLLDVQTEKGVRINTHVTSISGDKEGRLWISSLEQGVFSYHTGTHTLQQYTEEADDERYALTCNQICFLYVEEDGAIWASSRRKGVALNYRAPGSDRFRPYVAEGVAEPFTVYAMAEMGGYLWMGSWTDGLYRLHKPSGEIKSYLVPCNDSGANHIHSMLAYEDGKLLIGSDDGLHYFDTRSHEYTLVATGRQRSGGLSDKFIYPIYRDREGGLWIGTYYGGVNYSPPRKGNIEGYVHSAHTNSVQGNIISCFCEDREGNIWIGSDDGGLNYFDTQTGAFTHYMPAGEKKGLSYHNVHALYLENNKLWIGIYTGGLNVLDLKTMKFKWYDHAEHDEHSLDNSSVYSIHKDVDGRLWVGTMSGLLCYDRENDHFIRMKHTGYTTLNMADDGQRRLWFATGGGGLYRYSLDSRQWKQYLHCGNDKASIPSNEVNCLCFWNGKLWIGTNRGLCTYDERTDGFIPLPLHTPSSYICSITEDDDCLWLATTNGLVRYLPESNTWSILSQTDGLQSDQFALNAVLRASSGKMYLGTMNGFNVIDPRSISRNRYVPPVYITNLQVFNKDEAISACGVLRRSIEYTSEITLSHKQNMFSLEFASLSYSMPSKNQYMYRLEGFDKDWNKVNNQRKAIYTNLPAGRYLFRVIASNDDGVWNSAGASLSIVVRPPLWRSLWAYILYVSLVLGVTGFLLYRNRKRVERRHQQKIQQLNVEKEKEIHEARMKFFTFIAHEIRTPLSLIIGPLEKITRNGSTLPATLRGDLDVIERNSWRLHTLVNQLLDFQKAEQGAFTIRLARVNIYDLLHGIYRRFSPLAEQSDVSFELYVPDRSLQATVDAEALTKIISNLLSNAMKYALRKVILSGHAGGDYLYVKIEDDGCGIAEKEQKNIFIPFYQVAGHNKPGGTGIGLSLVKLLVDAHHGMIEVDSEPDKGSAFLVTLPLCPAQAKECTSNLLDCTVQEVVPAKEAALQYSPLSVREERDAGSHHPILLIVEDNVELSEFLYQTFESSYVILLAKHGKEGLELLKNKTVDLIISDVMMPVLDGIAFAQEVRKNILCSHIPIIFLTARTDNESKVAGIKAGADIYVEKPFSPHVLKAQIECLLASRRTLRQKFSEMPFIPLNSIAGNKDDELFLSKMNEIIEKNISNINFTIDTLAEQLCVSRSGLFIKIRKQTDMTPNDLIRVIRLKKAAELLMSNAYRVNEICYRVGFTSPSYFSKCFQKQFGILPKDFRDNYNDLTETN